MEVGTAEDRKRAREMLEVMGAHPRITTEDGTVLDLPASIVEALGNLLEAAAEGEPALVVRSTKDLTTEQAAAVLGVSRPTVVRLVEAGKLPARMVGTHRRLTLADVLAYRKVESAAVEQSELEESPPKGWCSEEEVAEAYRQHSGALLAFARNLLSSAALAEEVVQEVFVRLWTRPQSFDPARGALRSYLLTQTRWRCVDLIRAEESRRLRERRVSVEADSVVPDADEHQAEADWNEALASVSAAGRADSLEAMAQEADALELDESKLMPLSGDEFVARVPAAAPATADDVSITLEGRRLDSKEAVLAWLAEVEAERAAGRFVEFDEP